MASLEFGVLGPIAVRREDETIAVTAAKQRKLVALLLSRANEPVAQEELIDVLWDGDPPRTARAAFQNLVHALRRLLGPEVVERTPAGYRIRTSPEALDLDRFRRLVAEARRAPVAARAERLREALALWRGPPFPELSAPALTARLEEERLTALEDRLDADLELGMHLTVVGELEELVARHSSRERLWAQLMLALYRAGRQADALSAYRRAHDTFVETLGIEPGVVLRELQRAILVQDAALDDSTRRLGSTLERAAAILPREPRERGQSLYEYGSALIRIGQVRDAASTLEAAARLAEGAGERGLAERARLLLSYLAVFVEGGTLDEHLSVAEHAAGVFEELGDAAGLAFALSHQAHMHRDLGRAELALGLALHGANLAAGTNDALGEMTCRRMAATCAALGPTPVDEAIGLCRSAEASPEEETEPPPGWDVLAWLLAQSGRIHEARALYSQGLAALRERGLLLALTVGLARAALAERAAGDLDRAADHLSMAYALDRAEGMSGDLAAVASELACVLALRGEREEAVRLIDESRTLLARGDVVAEVLWRRAQALVAARDGRHQDAVELSDDARVRAGCTDWLTFRGETLEEAAHVRSLARDGAGVAESLAEALVAYEEKGNVAGAARVRRRMAGPGRRREPAETSQQS